ncbi:L,D-transpeptidase [Streptomyces sp. NPDC001410]|uniref:L,D-transpeptidase n=1 Tax=Streptomyces sp. NPDC001410 TaxID=3364574 RepID=UPI0036A61E0F
MSDDRDYDADLHPDFHPELSGGLRTLAESHQSSPPVAGAEVRRLAVRRGRRRRTTVVVGGVAAAAALAVTMTVGLTHGHDSDSGRRTTPAASPRLRTGPAPTPTPTPAAADAVVDLTKMTMTVDGRMMPISSGVSELPTPTGRFTVVAKSPKAEMEFGSGGGSGSGASMPSVPWVIELRSADRKRSTAVVALTYDLKAPGNYASTGGWIGLPEADAKWVYTRLDKGAVVLVTGRTPSLRPSASTPS